MYGVRAAAACRDAVAQSHSSAPTWSEEGCRTFQSVVEEFFHMQVNPKPRGDEPPSTEPPSPPGCPLPPVVLASMALYSHRAVRVPGVYAGRTQLAACRCLETWLRSRQCRFAAWHPPGIHGCWRAQYGGGVMGDRCDNRYLSFDARSYVSSVPPVRSLNIIAQLESLKGGGTNSATTVCCNCDRCLVLINVKKKGRAARQCLTNPPSSFALLQRDRLAVTLTACYSGHS